MSEVAVQVSGLSKQYRIGALQKRHDTLRDHIVSNLKSLFGRRGSNPALENAGTVGSAEQAGASDTFWALKDVSFDVKQGEVLGLIGRNGAGKSTLLKILSRITEPTHGRIEIEGRVSSLLEVGTGFSGELTGRDNIYLNGTIMGMKKAEINRRFDEIVAFSEVEQFLDTPVKHYSSGMYLRLAFAVAAHLEPEILIVDEVLAVGDAAFQKKCMGKMAGVAKEGRTVIFVSHNMPAVTRLCERAILLDEGRVVHDGKSHDVVSAYLTSGCGTRAVREWRDPDKAPGGEVVRLCAVRVRTKDSIGVDTVDIRRPVGIVMEYEVIKPNYVLLPIFDLRNDEGMKLFSANDHDPAWRGRPRPAGRYISTAWIPGNFLSEGTMIVDTHLTTMAPSIWQFVERDVVAFQVTDSMDGDSARGDYAGPFGGVVRPLLEWNTEFRPKSVETEASKSVHVSKVQIP
ncbi:MAG: polysaccharide ABC transporter ATP-binding protein [Nitrospirota bacterium]